MTAAVVALAVALATVAVAAVVGMGIATAWARSALAAESTAVRGRYDAEAVAARAQFAADTADALRIAAEERVRRVEAALKASQGVVDAISVPRDRDDAVAFANLVLLGPDGGATTADAAAPDHRRAGVDGAVPAQPTAAVAGGAVPGLPVR